MSNEAKRLRCIYRIGIMQARDAEGNKYLINKLKRKLRKLEEIKE